MPKIILFLFLFILLASSLPLLQGSRIQPLIPHSQRVYQGSMHYYVKKNTRRLMIGSVAPTCTYNECRGCKYKCRAEQVPVEGNDPMNSPYHYKCVCHR
ncbi:EPIDERMAL PATTERNING FACTOR-like protein 9 [Solanum verrucosum]|uniref:EPIDERMAL PATTERNING FACTOR-like protein 9 n=1 Tax=Solanum verrucosum TaxID=315347 RepID=UPI0020D1DBB3|nr:EPIDERMAL PATTERNING FACTOR-like protein 9 [Solanum verrucosum]